MKTGSGVALVIRPLLLVVLATPLALVLAAPPPAPRTAAAPPSAVLAEDGTPASGEPLVILARDEPRVATPTGEQTLRLAGPREGPETLDPALARDLQSTFLVRQVFRGLTRFDANLRPVPELAERIEVAADGLKYTFTLRADANFHDGRLITAADVVFSLSRALDPATAGGEAALLAGPTYLSDIVGAADLIAGRSAELAGVRAVDERTVEIRLVGPRATFLMKLAGVPASIVDASDVSRGADWWQAPNGSGPFRIADWAAGDHLTFVGYEEYFAGPPPLTRIEVRLGGSASQPFNLYQAGQIDVSGLPVDAVDRVTDAANPMRDEVTETPLFALGYIAFRADTPPMDDPHVRRAIQLAFPRDKIASVTYNGHLAPAPGPIPRGMLGREWPVDVEPYSLDEARREIAASRYGTTAAMPPLRIFGADYGGAEALREVLETDLGLDVEVISVPWSEYNDGLRRRSYPAYELYWGADYPDPETILWSLFGSDSADNYIDYHDDAFDELLRAAAREQDPDRRAPIYAEAQQVLMDDHVVIPLFHDVAYTLVKPGVKGLEITSLGVLRLETVWMEREP